PLLPSLCHPSLPPRRSSDLLTRPGLAWIRDGIVIRLSPPSGRPSRRWRGPRRCDAAGGGRNGRHDPRTTPLSYSPSSARLGPPSDRKSTRLNSSHEWISYAV